MVATPVLLLVHVWAPAAVSPSVVVLPTQSDNVPVIGGSVMTVTVVAPVAVMPQASVIVRLYVVVPAGDTVTGDPESGPGVQE